MPAILASSRRTASSSAAARPTTVSLKSARAGPPQAVTLGPAEVDIFRAAVAADPAASGTARHASSTRHTGSASASASRSTTSTAATPGVPAPGHQPPRPHLRPLGDHGRHRRGLRGVRPRRVAARVVRGRLGLASRPARGQGVRRGRAGPVQVRGPRARRLWIRACAFRCGRRFWRAGRHAPRRSARWGTRTRRGACRPATRRGGLLDACRSERAYQVVGLVAWPVRPPARLVPASTLPAEVRARAAVSQDGGCTRIGAVTSA